MATKVLEVVVCDLCTTDRPAVAHVEVDVCGRHGEQIAARVAGAVEIVCETCGKAYTTRSGLRSHVKAEHPEARKATVKCDICGQLFINNSGLGAHRRRAHGIAGTVKKRRAS